MNDNTYIAAVAAPETTKPATWWVAPDGPITDEIMAQVDPKDYISMRRLAKKMDGVVMRNLDTRSMLGTGYRDNNLLVVRPPDNKYEVGDDVAFSDKRVAGGGTLHRITAVKPGFVYTKGINNKFGDGWIPVEEVFGRIVYPKRKM